MFPGKFNQPDPFFVPRASSAMPGRTFYNRRTANSRMHSLPAFDDINQQLEQRERDGLYRRRRVAESPVGREITLHGKRLLNFCSNDYLGLANDERVRTAFVQGVEKWGVGSGASHLVSGHSAAHHELEEALADFTGRRRCLLFSSGYAANLGTVTGLLGKTGQVYEDRLNHASLLDGGLLSGARFRRFRHRDSADLDAALAAGGESTARKLVISDGTFSMDGTVCDVTALAAVARKHGAWLMIDEAHSLGVLGNEGCGLIDPRHHDTDAVQVQIGTLGKAFGTFGGFVTGSEALIETLIQSARTYIYTTAMPAAVAVATLASLKIAREEEWRREKLQALVHRFRDGAQQLGLDLQDSATPIQPVILGTEARALAASAGLEQQGLLVTAIRPPTVPKGTARLRITLTALHTEADVDRLLSALEICTG